jgi:hypothetical protein
MKKDVFRINREYLEIFGIDPQEGIDYLENKKAIEMNPNHVKVHAILKQKPLVSSSHQAAI